MLPFSHQKPISPLPVTRGLKMAVPCNKAVYLMTNSSFSLIGFLKESKMCNRVSQANKNHKKRRQKNNFYELLACYLQNIHIRLSSIQKDVASHTRLN